MLYTKSIFTPIDQENDGLRISVMSRHTLDDGKIKDTRITSSSFDRWFAKLAPPPALVGAYLQGQVTWKEYEAEYKSYLRINKDVSLQVEGLARMTLSRDVTLLCAEETAEHCHRRLLAEECVKVLREKGFSTPPIEHH